MLSSTIKSGTKKGRSKSDESPQGSSFDNHLMLDEVNEISAESVPTTDLDLVHYIIAHGIIQPDMRFAHRRYLDICKDVSKPRSGP